VAVASRGKRFRARWALGSVLLHALLLTFAATRRPQPAPAPAVVAKTEVEIDVVPEPLAPAPEEAHAPSDAVADDQRRAVPSGAALRDSVHTTEVVTDETAPSDADAGAAPGEVGETPSALPSAAAPHLSLAELGIEGTNPFLDRPDPAAVRAAKAARVKRRLDQALAQGITNQESARGRGVGSPVIRALESLMDASAVPLNGNASFTFVFDADGALVSSSLGQASGDRTTWARVVRQTAAALAGRKLSVPKGHGVKLTLAVTSHLELPSGADPGLEVDAFGIPLKKGGGPRSTKLDLFNLKHPLTTIALDGDPADLAAPARRMVHAHVVSEEIL
jgi:hypothetical protein